MYTCQASRTLLVQHGTFRVISPLISQHCKSSTTVNLTKRTHPDNSKDKSFGTIGTNERLLFDVN